MQHDLRFCHIALCNYVFILFPAALICSEVPTVDQSVGKLQSFIEFSVKETNEKVTNFSKSFILYVLMP